MSEECQSTSIMKEITCEHLKMRLNYFVNNEDNTNYIIKMIDYYNSSIDHEKIEYDKRTIQDLATIFFYKKIIDNSKHWYIEYLIEIVWIALFIIAAIKDNIDSQVLLTIALVTITFYLITQQDRIADNKIHSSMKQKAKKVLEQNQHMSHLFDRLQNHYKSQFTT